MLKKKKRKFVQVTGELSMKERVNAVSQFNSIKGSNVLFITKAGGEGLDLKGVQNVILLESMWNRPNEQQIIGRAIRYKSHTHLPKDQRHVNIYHMMVIKPGTPIRKKDDRIGSADEILKALTIKKMKVNREFLRRLKKLSIERKKTC